MDVTQGEPGEICVRGPSVISAYAGGASTAVFQDGWFRTGDLGYQDADGYLYITGRQRDVIIRGGENIAPREIEEVLLADPLVRDVAVVGQPDPLYGQQVVAYLHDDITVLAATLEGCEPEMAGAGCPFYEELCDEQTRLYARMFRS